ncbi:TSUP family transporter [Dactylosporangium cerinum]
MGFLIGVVLWRRFHPRPGKPGDRAFAGIGAASGFGSALLGSVGPLTAPFFLAYGLARAAYIGTEAAAALTMHLTKIAVYGAGDLLTGQVLLYGAALTPATIAGAWAGRKIVGRISDRVFIGLVEAGLVGAGLLFLPDSHNATPDVTADLGERRCRSRRPGRRPPGPARPARRGELHARTEQLSAVPAGSDRTVRVRRRQPGLLATRMIAFRHADMGTVARRSTVASQLPDGHEVDGILRR